MRAEKEKYVQELILTSFQNEFIYLDKFDMETMLRTMNGYPLSQMQMLALEENYCKKGWVFMFCDVMECSLLFRMRSESLLSKIWRRIRCKIYLVLLPLSAFPCERV